MRLTLGVRDMDILRSFYRTPGWSELPNGDNSWTGFLLGGVLLHHLVPRSVLESDIVLGSLGALSAGNRCHKVRRGDVNVQDKIRKRVASTTTEGICP